MNILNNNILKISIFFMLGIFACFLISLLFKTNPENPRKKMLENFSIGGKMTCGGGK